MAQIELKNIYKKFGADQNRMSFIEMMNPFAFLNWSIRKMQADVAVNPRIGAFSMENLNLTIPDGKVMVILGPSGCGKSTLLRIIAGLIRPDSGEIFYDGVNMETVPPGERRIGTPEDIYNSPHSLFVAEFLNLDGETPAINLLEGRVISQNLQGLLVGVRSQDIELCEKNTSAAFPGTIVDIRQIPLKSATVLGVKIGENELYVRLPLKQDVSRNDEMCLRFKKYHLFDKNSGLRVRSYE